MEISLYPYPPWQWVVTSLAGAAGLLLLVCFALPGARVKVFSGQPGVAWGVLLFSLASAALFALAAWNPLLIRQAGRPEAHLVAVVDVSKSILSAPGGWPEVQAAVAETLDELAANLPQETLDTGMASLVLVGEQTSVKGKEFPMAELANTFRRVNTGDFPGAAESDLAAGLERAGALIASAGEQGAVLLVTDGNQTRGDALKAAGQLARSGIPIYVLPVEGWSSAVYLAAIDLPNQVEVGQETFLRGLVWNRLDAAESIDLRITQNSGVDQPDSPYQQQVTGALSGASLAPNAWRSLREGLVFSKTGIQMVDIVLETGSPKIVSTRRLFTHAGGPPRLLAVGGDNRWVDWFSSGDFQIDLAEAANLPASTRFADYDLVVLNGVDASQFQGGVMEALAQAVREEGVGLFFVNGGHAPRDEEQPAVLTSYKGTPVETLLPVSVEPRPFTKDPPALQIVMLIDTSGSMEGEKLELAKAIAAHVIRTLMRPIDRLDVILFTTGANHIVVDELMTLSAKERALATLGGVGAGGGTEPSQALQAISGRKLVNCGLIFLSDGEFYPVSERPECQTVILDIGQDYVDPNFPLDLADPIPVGSSFNVAGLKLPIFEPEPRNKFFEMGAFTPLRTPSFTNDTFALSIPEGFTLDGSAVSYVKPEADLIAVRPKLIDPVLAYMAAGEGMVGVLTGEMSPVWLEDAAARQSARDWLLQTIPYSARSRYAFQVTDLGNTLRLCIEAHLPENQPAKLDSLTAELSWPGGLTTLAMERDAHNQAAFCGVAALPAGEETRIGSLTITETGPNALGRAQRIPMLVPPAIWVAGALTQEDYSAGVNLPLLHQLASAGGGEVLPAQRLALFPPQPDVPDSLAPWPWLLIAGLVCYLCAILLRRLDF